MTAGPARILIIAGSDSGGGAGIQADIKTASALNCYAMTAITAVTAQNTIGVRSIHLVPSTMVREQIAACLDDIGADAIKIGMLGSKEIVDVVADTLSSYAAEIPVVLDPVMVAKGGAVLGNDDVIESLKARLIPMAAVVTPNAPEASCLTGLPLKTRQDCVPAGKAIVALGAKAVLIKGGHFDSAVCEDLLVDSRTDDELWFRSNRIETRHTHGTGCTLSTAIACGLGQGRTLSDSVERAHRFVFNAILDAPGFGAGHGPLNHMHGRV